MSSPDFSARVPHGAGQGQQSVAVSTSSAATSAPLGNDTALVYSTVECFVVAGPATPTATVATGLPIPALTLLPLSGLKPTDYLAFITATGSGTVYIVAGT